MSEPLSEAELEELEATHFCTADCGRPCKVARLIAEVRRLRAAPAANAPTDENGTVPLDREAVGGYLDREIRSWRERRDKDPHAHFYVDAFQAVRESLLGSILP